MNPSFSPNLLSDVHELLRYPFMVNALQAGTVVALMCAVVGWFVVLRRASFAAHTLSTMSFPGAAGAAFVGAPLFAGYLTFCAGGALLIAAATGRRRSAAEESAVIGAVQVGAFALGFLFLSLYGGILESLETLLFGSFLGVTRAQVLTLVIVTAAVLAFFAACGRPLLFASVDEDVARAGRVPVRALSVAFLLVLGLAVAAAAQITGVLLVFALLVGPAATAQQLTTRIGRGLLLSAAFALLTVWIGLALAYYTNDSVGFFVASLAVLSYGLARLAARR
jgi:zinc/manganese transport system permease protein